MGVDMLMRVAMPMSVGMAMVGAIAMGVPMVMGVLMLMGVHMFMLMAVLVLMLMFCALITVMMVVIWHQVQFNRHKINTAVLDTALCYYERCQVLHFENLAPHLDHLMAKLSLQRGSGGGGNHAMVLLHML
jgi:hypothetical protein